MPNNAKAFGPVATTALMIAAALMTRKSAAKTWSTATGKPPPPDKDNEEIDLREAVAWAVVSGAAVGLARVLARRFVAYRGTPTDDRKQ